MMGQHEEHGTETAEGYPAVYGLTCEPFSGEMLPSFFYPGATREQRLNLLLHLVPLGETLLITGVPGVGKSALLDQFVARAQESWHVCRLDASAGLDSTLLLQQLVQTFSPEAQGQTDRAEMERFLIAHLQALRKNAQIPMLLVDNAHNISETGLRALSKFITDEPEENRLFGVVLFSEPEIEEKLSNPALQALRTQIKHTFELPLLSEEETLQYIDRRMHAAGLEGDSPFTAAVNRAIFGASKGLPLKINELAQAVLQNKRHATPPAPAGTDADVKTVSKPAKGKRMSVSRLWPLAAATVLASVLFFQDEINSLFNPLAEKLQSSEPKIIKESLPEIEAVTPLELQPNAQGSIGREVSAAPETEVSVPEIAVEDKANHIVDVDEVAVSAEPTSEIVAESMVNNESEQPVEVDHVLTADIETQATALPVATLASDAPGEAVATEQPLSEAASTPLMLQSATEESDWVMGQQPEAYTLQIVAQEKLQKREAFITRFGLENDVKRFSTNKQGQRWYVAVSGAYNSRTEALEASRQLPEGVVPWVRSFASIRKELWREAPADVVVESAEVTSSTSPVSQADITAQERWVMARSPEHFVLQLVAFEKEAKTRNFIASHGLGEMAKQVRLINKGRVWYVAIYGDAADRSAAQDLADNLIDNNDISQSWVRSYGSLQQAMQAFQQK